MSETLTPKQALLVWCLLAKQGGAWQAQIKPPVGAGDRKALERMKILSSTTIKGYGTALWLELDPDRGWGWAAEHLDAELPPSHRGFSDLLLRLKHHLEVAEESLADIIGAGPGAPPEKSGKTSGTKPIDARAAIERAYLAITKKRKGVDVRLSDLRAKLALPRAAVDAALETILGGDAKARLMRIDDQRSITPADKDAAFVFASEPFHILWIMP